MASEKISIKCKYFNTGFCKYKDECQYFHPKEICEEVSCINKGCRYRHPKQCRYKDQCHRRSLCAYRHENVEKSEYYKIVWNENIALKLEISNMKVKLEETFAILKIVSKDLENIKKDPLTFCKSCEGNAKDVRDLMNELHGVKSELSFLQCPNCGLKYMDDREWDEHTTYIQEHKQCPEIQESSESHSYCSV